MSTKTVILTGASRGIGLAILTCLLQDFHANVVTISRTRTPELALLEKKYPRELTALLGDVTEEKIHAEAVSASLRKYGGLDSVILNAGVLHMGRTGSPTLSIETWKSHFDTNFFALLRTVQVAAPELRKSRGSMILVSSGLSSRGAAGFGPYSAGKAAMNSLARTLGEEEKAFTTISFRPGSVDTAMLGRLKGEEGAAVMDPKEYQGFKERKPLSPEVPGYVIACLAAKGPPKELSGQYIAWDSPEVKEYRKQF
ncbi:short-chain dehydrogenase [Clavulina sp. PMI_390]|nr:short-chain dehydrogenase [Clavulina sp. PMI_390]